HVADANVLSADIILVVQGGELDRDAAQTHRLQDSIWIHRTCPADVYSDLFEPGGRDLPGELVCDCPARVPADRAEHPFILEAVDLDYHSIYFIIERLALWLPALAKLQDTLDRFVPPIVRVYWKSPFLQHVQGFLLGLQCAVLDVANSVREKRKRSSCGHLR